MRIYLLAMFYAQVYSVRALRLDSKEQVMDSLFYDHNIIVADSFNRNGNNLADLLELINEENVPINNAIGGVLENYLQPLSKLSELFPNQQVEVQLEIGGSNDEPKRYLRQKPFQRELLGEASVLPSSTPPISTTSTPNRSSTNSVNDRPVYMSDLKKVFDDFEKKHTKFHDDVKPAPFVNIKQSIGNLNDLLGLLKKGIQVEKGVGKPTGENMSWFQIKIPRT